MTQRATRLWLGVLGLAACTACNGQVVTLGQTGSGGASGGSTSTGGSTATGGSGGSSAGTGGSGGSSAGTGGSAGSSAGTGGSGGSSAGTGGSAGSSGTPAACGGVACKSGEQCCLTTGMCFDPVADPGACKPATGAGLHGQKACSSSAQCAPGMYCEPNSTYLCLGPGSCAPTNSCAHSTTPACGCNGVTYPNVQAACAAGVAVIGQDAACGDHGGAVTYCGTDDQCSGGQKCCGITGRCYDPSEPALCAFPPAGTFLPCIDNSQCGGHNFCKGQGCGTPGGCVGENPSDDTCSGQLDPVCGCDGQSYVNADCAAVAGTRVAHTGQCP